MNHDVFMAGFGGQGVLLIGNLLAQAAIDEGKNASFFPAYGVEKRGGAATCTIVVSDGEVGSPVIGNPGAALIFNDASMKYFERLRPGAFCLVNSSLIEDNCGERSDLDLLRLPLNEMALDEVGDARMVNMIAIGAYVARTGVVSLDSLKNALKKVLPERNHRFLPLNNRAIDLGASCATK